MNKDLTKAKEMLIDGGYTCVFCKDDTIYTSKERGVKPILEHINNNTDMQGFSVADKVVGKASAYLYTILKVDFVYAAVVTQKALDVFAEYGIEVEFGTVVEQIRNRTNTGMCPMEEATQNVNTPEQVLEAVTKKLEMLRNGLK